MEAEDKTGFAVQNEPEIVFLPLYLDHGFIGVPFVRVKIECRNKLYSDILEQRSEAGTPIANSCVGHLDIHHGTQDQSDIAE